MDTPTQHVLLRDRRHWLGRMSGTALERDGGLTLLPVPAPADGRAVLLPGPYPAAREVSGLALGPCGQVLVADTVHDRVLLVEPQCGTQAWVPGFKAPRGLALDDDALRVADSGHARVQGLALPALEAGWAPVQGRTVHSVALDAQQRLLFVDAAHGSLHRLQRSGMPDPAFDRAVAASGRLKAPLFVALAGDALLVSDGAHDRVDLFDAAGRFTASLDGPPGWRPGALAADTQRRYVADAADGRILVFDAAGQLQGAVHGWRGPVTALALAADGDLYIKPGLDAAYLRFVAGGAHANAGRLVAGPFDAGVERAWERAWLEAELPAGTTVTMEVAQADSGTSAPAAGDWTALPGTDALLAPLAPAVAQRRYLWMRLTLATTVGAATPVLRQARASTAAEDLRRHLPATYRLHDPHAVLQRLLQLLQGEFLAVEEQIDAMPRVADPQFAAATSLGWLAQWLDLELPVIADDDERRALIARAAALFARRGSPASIAELVQLHTGVRPAIVEAFTQRRLWVLGQGSRLGFDTQLPSLDPMGLVLADPAAAPGCCPGAEDPPAIGRAVVGESGPLASHQVGLPLVAEEAYRFCVVVDAYRVRDPATLQELQRIVDREKPAHTDYRVEVVQPGLRVGLQALVGVDTIVGGPAPGWQLGRQPLGHGATLMPPDAAARVGDMVLDATPRP